MGVTIPRLELIPELAFPDDHFSNSNSNKKWNYNISSSLRVSRELSSQFSRKFYLVNCPPVRPQQSRDCRADGGAHVRGNACEKLALQVEAILAKRLREVRPMNDQVCLIWPFKSVCAANMIKANARGTQKKAQMASFGSIPLKWLI